MSLKTFHQSAFLKINLQFRTRPLIPLYYLATTAHGNKWNMGVRSVCVSVNGMCALSLSFSSSVWEASCELFHVVFTARVITTAEMLMAVWIRHRTRGHRGLGAVFDLLIPSARWVLHTVFFKLRRGIGSEAKVHKWESCAFKWRHRNAECCKLALGALSLATYSSS